MIFMKSIKTPNHPAYHWSPLWPLEVWVRGLYNSWWFCDIYVYLFIYDQPCTSVLSWIKNSLNIYLSSFLMSCSPCLFPVFSSLRKFYSPGYVDRTLNLVRLHQNKRSEFYSSLGQDNLFGFFNFSLGRQQSNLKH